MLFHSDIDSRKRSIRRNLHSRINQRGNNEQFFAFVGEAPAKLLVKSRGTWPYLEIYWPLGQGLERI